MDYRSALRSLLFCLCLVIGNAASASSEFVRVIQTRLYAGEIDKAAESAKARVIAAPADKNARFAMGAVQFLQAVERLGQSLHRYGLHSKYEGSRGLVGLPILRLPVSDNPKPDELTYEKFRNILKTFVANLKIAEATLAKIKSGRIDLPLNIGRIRLDLNGDGKGGEDEALWRMFAVVTSAGGWLNEGTAQKLLTDFDGSDIPWLRAYCHLLMAIAEFPLAHDWQRAFETTFPGIFHMPKSASQRKFDEALAEARSRLAEIGPVPARPFYPHLRHLEKELPDYLKRKKERERIQQLRWPLETRLSFASGADLIAFIHLTHWPVVERNRLASVLWHTSLL